MFPARNCDRSLVRDNFIKISRALDCSSNHESFLSITKNIPSVFVTQQCVFSSCMLHLPRPWVFFFTFLYFFFFFAEGTGGDNTAYGSRRQGWMVCVGTLIICMSLQNALLLFAPAGCCACFTSSLPQSQEVQGNKASAIQSRHSRVPHSPSEHHLRPLERRNKENSRPDGAAAAP